MKIRFWGVRGSFAMTGRDFLRYGGNTSSVELVAASGERLNKSLKKILGQKSKKHFHLRQR